VCYPLVTEVGSEGGIEMKVSMSTMRNLVVLAAVLTLLCLGGIAHAASVNYNLGNLALTNYPGPNAAPSTASHVLDGLGYPGDAVGFQGSGGTLVLTPGTSTQKIGELLWNISYTYAGAGYPTDPDAGWAELSFYPSIAPSISFTGGPSGSLSQSGLLEVNWDNDYLTLSGGTTSSFLVSGYQVDVTPLAVTRTGGTLFPGFPGGTPWVQPNMDVMATFEVSKVTAVPEPSTMLFLGFALVGLAGVGRKFKK
jgi:hypothetical protein